MIILIVEDEEIDDRLATLGNRPEALRVGWVLVLVLGRAS